MSRGAAPIYLDHAAATPVDPRVLERFLEVERRCPANPSSLHAAGRLARGVVEEARAEVAAALVVSVDAVLFVSGGTEGNVTAIRGSGATELPVLLAPAVEHASVAVPARAWRGIVPWSVTPSGRAEVTEPGTAVGLISLSHAQSEVGTLQPVEDAADLAVRLGVPLHVDAAQSLGRVSMADAFDRADTVSLSTHKAGGLRGASVLIVPRGAVPEPLILGGGQERGHRAGTPSPALIAATAAAIRLAEAERSMRSDAMRRARDVLVAELGRRSAAITVTPSESILPNLAMLRFDGLDGRALLPALDLSGVQASQGAACSSGSPEPPPILIEMGMDDSSARRCVRFSVSHDTTIDVVRDAVDRIDAAVVRLRAASSRAS